MRYFYRLLIAITAAIAFLGCPSREYSVVIHNVGKETVYEAHVSYGAFQSRGGVIVASASKGQGGVREPIPEKAIVEWRLEDGTLYRREVVLKEVVPRDFAGEIWFEIDSDDVRVVVSRSIGPG